MVDENVVQHQAVVIPTDKTPTERRQSHHHRSDRDDRNRHEPPWAWRSAVLVAAAHDDPMLRVVTAPISGIYALAPRQERSLYSRLRRMAKMSGFPVQLMPHYGASRDV